MMIGRSTGSSRISGVAPAVVLHQQPVAQEADQHGPGADPAHGGEARLAIERLEQHPVGLLEEVVAEVVEAGLGGGLGHRALQAEGQRGRRSLHLRDGGADGFGQPGRGKVVEADVRRAHRSSVNGGVCTGAGIRYTPAMTDSGASAIGLVVNPMSGRDVRRLVGRAQSETPESKRNQLQRAVVGAAAAGAECFLLGARPLPRDRAGRGVREGGRRLRGASTSAPSVPRPTTR